MAVVASPLDPTVGSACHPVTPEAAAPVSPLISLPCSAPAPSAGPDLPNGKFCLDLCASACFAISTALLELGHMALALNTFVSDPLELLDDIKFERILRIAA